MGFLRPPKGARQVSPGCERRFNGIDPAGQPGRDLLQEPAVAVRIPERRETAVGGGARRAAADAIAAVRFELSARGPAWNTSLTSAPPARSWSLAASMSETTK
jgi:hypothetical protein